MFAVKYRLSGIACAVMLTMSAAAVADVAADVTDDKALEALLSREVQGASRFAQSLMDAPASITVIERRESDALGHQTVGDMLSRLPGVYVTNSRSYSALGLRGFNRPGDYSSRVLIAIDGQRVNDAIYDQGLPEFELPVVAEWVKRLELVQGPGSSVYGSNALLGVVNVVTLEGADAPGIRTQLSIGEQGLRRAEVHYGAADADQDLFLGLHLYRSKGEDLYLPELGSSDGWVRGLDGERQAALLAKYRYGPWRASLNAVRREKDPPTAPYGTLAGVRGTTYSDSMVLGELSYDDGWQGDLRKTLRLDVAAYDFRGRYVFEQVPELINKDVARAQWTTVEGRLMWRGLLNHQMTVGAEARTSPHVVQRNFDVQPYRLSLDSNVTQDSLAAFVQDQWRLSSALHLTTGLRLDHVRGFPLAVSPRLVMAFRPDERESLKLMWARSFRTPNVYERFYEDGGISQLSNLALRPEHVGSTEAAWEYLLPSGQALSANVYYTRLTRLIEAVSITDAPDSPIQYRNVGRVTLRGLDLGVEQRSTGGWAWRMSASWMDARNDAGARLSNAPTWMCKGDVITPEWQSWQLGLEWNLLGPRRGRSEVPTAALVNTHLRYRIDERQSLALHVNNALDRRYADPSTPDVVLSSIPQPRRSLRLDWRFTL